MRIFILLFAILCLLNCLEAKTLSGTKITKALIPSEDYTHELTADEDNKQQYQLFWRLNNEDEIQFEIHCKTSGWVGLGLSPNGGMAGSDIILGWVKDNKTFIKDCHATGEISPQVDQKQDIDAIDGAEIDGYTILKFKRKLQTCDDKNDREITIGTQYLIFAWNNKDPVEGQNDWSYHGSNRLQRTVMLLNFRDQSIDQQSFLPSDTYTYSMMMPNLKIPAKDTFYYCDVYELPKFKEPNHMIQFEIIVDPNNKRNVHHLLAYECDNGFVPPEPLARECGSKELPTNFAVNCLSRLIIAWGIGGPANYSFPIKAGYRFEPLASTKYLLIEMHYDNPELKSDIVDKSGLRLYLTKQLRDHDLGLITLGTDGAPMSLQIPPQSNEFTYTSICYPQCTQKFIPDDGIYAVSALLHTHLAGIAVKTTLVRDDEIIQELFDNPNYDFNYQFLMDIEPVKLKKGDVLITQCKYRTRDRNKFTFFGVSTKEEMCFDFMYYYPRIPTFIGCASITPSSILYNFYRSLMKDSLMPLIELNETQHFQRQAELQQFLQNNVTKSDKLTKRFEEFFLSEYNKTFYCGDPKTESFFLNENVRHYKPKKNAIVKKNQCSAATKLLTIGLLKLILIIMIPIISFS